VITTPRDLGLFRSLLGDGEDLGLSLSYVAQDRPRGLADAFILGRRFIGEDGAALILGDNLFYGHDLPPLLRRSMARESGATVFAYRVANPQRYGVIEFGEDHRARSIEEKPTRPKSNYAVTGLYFYENRVIDLAAAVEPSVSCVEEIAFRLGFIDVDQLRRLASRCANSEYGRYLTGIADGGFI
jgi:glucose-1-phosphate thymidylyltransferase